MAYAMSQWFLKKSLSNRRMKNLIKGGYPKSKLYIKSWISYEGSFKRPRKVIRYRVMKRK